MTADEQCPPEFDIQIAIEAPSWPDYDVLEKLCHTTIGAAARLLASQEGQSFAPNSELSLLFSNDADIREINRQWRQQDKPTNVLSFPASAVEPGETPDLLLGDIMLAHETVEKEALALGISFDNHLTHLLVHGFLHLLGYDHENDDDAAVMEDLETGILATLNLSDPYENFFQSEER